MRLSPAVIVVVAVASASAQSCVKRNAQCGTASGFSCCETGSFCQPWDDNYYQCIAVPSGCSNMETNVDYNGDDIASFYGMKQPADCCNACHNNPECEFFTFINTWGPACYLKKGSGTKKTLVGAVSGRKFQAPAPAPSPVPPATPPSCSSGFEVDVDYYGADLTSVNDVDLAGCCERCTANADCKVFTYVPASRVCYLKTSDAGRVVSKGAVSGKRGSGSGAAPTPTMTKPPSCANFGAACGGATTCCDTQAAYCHPWDATNYQCIDKPSTCAAGLETDVDYYGADLTSVNDVDLDDCCERCTANADCKVFTYVPASRVCYLKTSDAGRVASKGAVSGKRGSGSGAAPTPTPPPPTTPSPVPAPLPTPPPSGNWDASRCGTQKRNLYYHGNDISGSERTFATVEQCCDHCRATSGCKAFTYFRRGSQQRCLLKTGIQGAEKTNYADKSDVYCMSGVF